MVVTGDEAIQVYEADGATTVTKIDFGISFLDSFGNTESPTHLVVVKNRSDATVEVIVTGDGRDDIIPVFGPTTGDLKAYPGNAFTLGPKGHTADMMMGYVGLTLSLLTSGSKTTTIIFRATERVGRPVDGLVAWWPGDGNANDIVGGNHGTLSGGATFTGGMVGQSFSFPTTNSAIKLPPAAVNGLGDVTLDAWVKVIDTNATIISGANFSEFKPESTEGVGVRGILRGRKGAPLNLG